MKKTEEALSLTAQPQNQEGGWNEVTNTRRTAKERSDRPTMDINEAHDKLGHAGEETLRKTFKLAGYDLIGSFRVCAACKVSNAKAANVCKTTQRQATAPGERLFVDMTGPFPESAGGSQYMAQVVDDYTRLGWCSAQKQKKHLALFVREVITECRNRGYMVNYIRCDNAGENTAGVKTLCLEMGITIELTAPYTPQHNGVCERRIAVNMGKARAALFGAKLTKETRQLLWAEAYNLANFNYNLTTNTKTHRIPRWHFFGVDDKRYYRQLIQFGRIGFVYEKVRIQGKLEPRATRKIMFGYA